MNQIKSRITNNNNDLKEKLDVKPDELVTNTNYLEG